MTARWGEITAREILSPIRGELIWGSPESVFTGLSTDSREIIPGQLFWVLKGERFDGHDFIGKAVEKGAAGIVIRKGARPETDYTGAPVVMAVENTLTALGDLAGWWRHKHNIHVVSITGSAGKTTTKEMAACIMELGARTLKNQGNFNNLVGLPLTLFLLEQGHDRAVLEMGMNRPGEIARLTRIADPDIGLITNVARAHLEGLGDINAVARAKVELIEEMSPDGRVVLNGDDKILMNEASRFSRDIITFGLGPENDIRADKIRGMGKEGTAFELQYDGRAVSIRLRVPGFQNVLNALAASTVAFCMNDSPEHVVMGLNNFKGLKGRFMVTSLPGGITLVDDTYNSNPSSLKAAIDSLRALVINGGRIIVGLGEMMELGHETVPAHIEAGGMVAELGACYFMAMGDHAGEMIEGAVDGGLPPERAVKVNTHDEMEKMIRDMVKAGDLIFLKGSRKMCLEKVARQLKGAEEV